MRDPKTDHNPKIERNNGRPARGHQVSQPSERDLLRWARRNATLAKFVALKK